MKEQGTVRQKKIKYLVMGPKGGPDSKIIWPTDRRSQNQLRTLASKEMNMESAVLGAVIKPQKT
jgi:hypothetical protein